MQVTNKFEGGSLMKKILALLLVTCMIFSMAACGNKEENNGSTTPEPTATTAPTETPDTPDTPDVEPVVEPDVEPVQDLAYDIELDYAGSWEPLRSLANKEYGVDYTDLYEKIGNELTIDDVYEDPDTGFDLVDYDGKTYMLGLNFLSMAMVYKTEIPEGSSYTSSDEIYAEWWKYYMQRWNYLLPEIPLYSNEYYDIYNAQIKGVAEHPTNPYWAPASALIDWSSEKEDNSIIIGNSTELSGKFRYAAFGGTNPGAADNDVQGLTIGLETAVANKEGNYQWNDTVVKSHDAVINEDGTKTFTITIHDDLLFSDGTPIVAKDYIARAMAFSTPVAAAAAGKDHKALMSYVGFEEFNTYDGTEGSGSKVMTGLRLLDEYTFQFTVKSDFIPYFYDIAYAAWSPDFRAMWIGEADIVDDGEGCYFTDDFYAKSGDKYVTADLILETSRNTDTTYPYSGPYVVKSYSEADKTAVLELNPNFKGNYEGTKGSIGTVIYRKIISETQLEDFKSGNVDCLAGITGGDATNEAITLADNSDGKYVYTHYSRAGYGKMGFRADYGPVQFVEVRQAIAYCMDRAKFAKDFTGGYGGVVDGPYYAGSWMYKAASAQGMLLNAYATSVDSAIDVLEQGGWIYDKDGNDYVSGVRYKKITADVATENDINYKSKDGAYVTTKVGDDYYMPLALNWYGTVDNEFSDLLVTGFMEAENVKAAGMNVQNTFGDFSPMLDELYQAAVYGYYSGSPMYSIFNFATGFNSAVYNYSFNLTIDPAMYDDYSAYYIKDRADAFWLK